jgi:hypothetical protein
MLGAILVHPGDGKPSDDFLLAAMELGFDNPEDVPRRKVYQHFG